MRREISGNTDEALTTPGVDCRELISGLDINGDASTFWCRGIIIYNSHAADDAVVAVFDQDEAVAVAANQRFTIVAPAGTTTFAEFAAPGFAFHVNMTAGVTGGTVAVYEAGAWGYLEGGME